MPTIADGSGLGTLAYMSPRALPYGQNPAQTVRLAGIGNATTVTQQDFII